MAAAWTDMDACPHTDEHEARAEAAMNATTHPERHGPAGSWRHVRLLDRGMGLEPVEIAVHQGHAGAAAAVTTARATEDDAMHWAEPVIAGPRPRLSD